MQRAFLGGCQKQHHVQDTVPGHRNGHSRSPVVEGEKIPFGTGEIVWKTGGDSLGRCPATSDQRRFPTIRRIDDGMSDGISAGTGPCQNPEIPSRPGLAKPGSLEQLPPDKRLAETFEEAARVSGREKFFHRSHQRHIEIFKKMKTPLEIEPQKTGTDCTSDSVQKADPLFRDVRRVAQECQKSMDTVPDKNRKENPGSVSGRKGSLNGSSLPPGVFCQFYSFRKVFSRQTFLAGRNRPSACRRTGGNPDGPDPLQRFEQSRHIPVKGGRVQSFVRYLQAGREDFRETVGAPLGRGRDFRIEKRHERSLSLKFLWENDLQGSLRREKNSVQRPSRRPVPPGFPVQRLLEDLSGLTDNSGPGSQRIKKTAT